MASRLATWSPLLIVLIPALLGSGAVFTTIGGYFTELRDDPVVKFNLFPETRSGSVEIENSGGGPATNLTAIITVPYNITDINYFSLETISLTNQSKLINVTMPKLNQGQGAVANISFIMDGADSYSENYDAYALYDKGSVRGTIVSDNPVLDPIINLLGWLIRTPIGIGILFTVIGLSAYLLYLWIKRRWASDRYEKVTNITSDLLAKAYVVGFH